MSNNIDRGTKSLNVPPLRFPEFSGEWERLLLGDISKIKTGPFGSALHADDYVLDGTPIVTTEHFKSGNLPYYKENIPQVSDEDYIRLKSYILEENDIVFSRVGSVDINALVTSIQAGWLFSGRVLRVRLLINYDSTFVHYVLSTKRVKQDILSRAVGQTMPSINTDILNNTFIYLPISVAEQQKIGSLLRHLDNRIETQKKIIEELKKLKSAIREKVFKQVELSCKDYATIGEMLDYEQPTEYIVDSTEYSDSCPIPVLTANKAYILGFTDETYGVYEKGECIIFDDFTMDVKYVDFPFKVKSSAIKILSAKEDVDLYFMYEYFQYLGLVSEEHKRHYISEIEPLNIVRPSLNTQRKFSKFLRSIDKSISFAIKLSTQYTKQKDYLLSQMFI